MNELVLLFLFKLLILELFLLLHLILLDYLPSRLPFAPLFLLDGQFLFLNFLLEFVSQFNFVLPLPLLIKLLLLLCLLQLEVSKGLLLQDLNLNLLLFLFLIDFLLLQATKQLLFKLLLLLFLLALNLLSLLYLLPQRLHYLLFLLFFGFSLLYLLLLKLLVFILDYLCPFIFRNVAWDGVPICQVSSLPISQIRLNIRMTPGHGTVSVSIATFNC